MFGLVRLSEKTARMCGNRFVFMSVTASGSVCHAHTHRYDYYFFMNHICAVSAVVAQCIHLSTVTSPLHSYETHKCQQTNRVEERNKNYFRFHLPGVFMTCRADWVHLFLHTIFLFHFLLDFVLFLLVQLQRQGKSVDSIISRMLDVIRHECVCVLWAWFSNEKNK